MMDTRLHCVYLLVSCDPRCKDACYIGYTTNPLRRLRQHNGEIANGAWRTKRAGRPWKLVGFVSGFPEDRMGLKFEWCWQHPTKALILRDALTSGSAENQRALQRVLASLGPSRIERAPHAIAFLHILLRCPLFSCLCLRLNVVDDEMWDYYTTRMYRLLTPPAAVQGDDAPTPVEGGGVALLMPFAKNNPLLKVVSVTTSEIEELLPNTAAPSQDDSGVVPHDESSVASASAFQWSTGCAGGGAPSYVRSLIGGSESASVGTMSTAVNNTSTRSNPTGQLLTQSDSGLFRQTSVGGEGTSDILCTLCAMPLTADAVKGTGTASSPAGPPIMQCQRPGECPLACHVTCLALWFQLHRIKLANQATGGPQDLLVHWPLVPVDPSPCPLCGYVLHWAVGVQQLKQRMNAEKGRMLAKRRQILDAALASRLAVIGRGGAHPAPSQDRRGNSGASRGRGRERVQRKRGRSIPAALDLSNAPHNDDDNSHEMNNDDKNVNLNTAVLEESCSAVEQPDWWLDL